jgi:hypothetical protein
MMGFSHADTATLEIIYHIFLGLASSNCVLQATNRYKSVNGAIARKFLMVQTAAACGS